MQQNGVQIHTMEHILAAVAGLAIDNLEIETTTMETPEPPDGSAAASVVGLPSMSTAQPSGIGAFIRR